jgi:predicted transposase/invertase (TIGR01784 family)
MEKISPQVDVAFKKIFGVEENKDLLISLINSIVSEEDQVSEVILLNPYNSKEFKNDKASILDIKAKNKDGMRFNIEIQITDEADYDKRALYYWAKLYSEQLEQGMGYRNLAKAIGIHILNFTSIPLAEKYHNAFILTEKETGIKYFKNMELHTLELNKFLSDSSNESLSKILPKIKTSLDRWMTFLTRHHLLQGKLPNKLNDPKLKKALQVIDQMNFTPEERELYEAHLKWLRLEESALRKCREDGKIEGKMEEKIETVINMLNLNLDLEMISKVTGLSAAEIRDTRNKAQV